MELKYGDWVIVEPPENFGLKREEYFNPIWMSPDRVNSRRASMDDYVGKVCVVRTSRAELWDSTVLLVPLDIYGLVGSQEGWYFKTLHLFKVEKLNDGY